jgi:hypothetical protein
MKRSAAKRARRRKPLTFYVDECLGRFVAESLTTAGFDVRAYHDHFAGVRDVDWLPRVGASRWILLTKDKNIRRNQLEVDAILNSGVRAFVVTAAGLHRDELAKLVLSAMPKIQRICQQRGPFIFNITASGVVSQISTRELRRRASKDRGTRR